MPPTLTSGEHARQRIERQLTHLHALQPMVLADRDPEPLHQFRVSLRRLRSLLRQFGPALRLPRHLSRSRITAVARATGRSRDADVLREWLCDQLLPRLSGEQRHSCKPLLRQLKRQRRQAFSELETELSSRRYGKLMDGLEQWCRSPRTTSLGDLELTEWLQEWLLPCTGGCVLHQGWFAADPAAQELHALRKRIKELRYGLEALEEWLGEPGRLWIGDLRRAQSCLGWGTFTIRRCCCSGSPAISGARQH